MIIIRFHYTKDRVQYPFGFGLSYTSYAYSDMAVQYNEKTDKFEVTLTVTNTGSVAGKETVQVYAQKPYTEYDKQNQIEKAAVELVGYGKTKLLNLTDVANTENKVPLEWITPEHNNVTKEFIDYALPLIQGEPNLPKQDSLPRFAKLKKVLAK